MALSEDEKTLIEEALSVYLQVIARQVSPSRLSSLPA